MSFDPSLIVVPFIAAIAGIIGGLLTARVTSKPATDEALTERFTALVDRQELERKNLVEDFDRREKKLEAVAADLEVMVIKLIEWADEVTVRGNQQGWILPPRPKFKHLNGSNPG
jgi:hypothetical protein